MTDILEQTDRTRLRRMYQRGVFDRAAVYAILDAQPHCSVGYVMDGRPYVTPTLQWRYGDRVYWHGSSASRAMRAGRGAEVCLTVSILDGFVMARSGTNHSVNARSVMLFGQAHPVADDQKQEVLTHFMERLWPGRSAMLRPDTAQELKATLILSMPIEEGSAKVRAGDPEDDEDDYGWPVWAGVIPVHTATLPPQADPHNLPDVELPAHIAEFKWEKQVIDR